MMAEPISGTAMGTDRNIEFIDTPEQLQQAANVLSDHPWFALDTEFLRERTYRPELCLLQIAAGDHLYCIDPLALDNIDCLLDVIYDHSIIKVLHAAGQDLEIFYWLRGSVPHNLFDTQVAAPLLGHPEQIGYANLVKQILNIDLNKSHSRADWTRRPLPEQQLAYAADDVIYLAQMYPLMVEQLQSLGRTAWLTPEWQAMTNAELYEKPSDQVWKKLKQVDKLKGQRLATAQQLAQWREETARKRNLPRNWLLKDDVLISMAKQLPADAENLKHIRGLSDGFRRSHGDAVLSIIEQSKQLKPAAPDPYKRKEKLTPLQDAAVDVLSAVAKSHAAELQINPSVLAPKKSLEDLVRGTTDTDIMQGWRATLIGEPIKAVLDGSRHLSFVEGALVISD
jgi:ribonuclease D